MRTGALSHSHRNKKGIRQIMKDGKMFAMLVNASPRSDGIL